MSPWVYVRLAIILGSGIGACLLPLGPQAAPPIGWSALAAIFGACSIGMVLVLGIQRVNPRSAKVWHRPSWTANPFNFKDPLQFFHLGAFVCLAEAVVTLIRWAFSAMPFYVEILVPSAMGLGILLGIGLTTVVFQSKFTDVK
jgi:hypothetical protein